mmetsp:Transcript_56192/g.123073  ORF Transcript_56192/g.123073 Transcript_56192/m.123073 type:complete len:201 (+) Transcript_56192:335-937(+)
MTVRNRLHTSGFPAKTGTEHSQGFEVVSVPGDSSENPIRWQRITDHLKSGVCFLKRFFKLHNVYHYHLSPPSSVQGDPSPRHMHHIYTRLSQVPNKLQHPSTTVHHHQCPLHIISQGSLQRTFPLETFARQNFLHLGAGFHWSTISITDKIQAVTLLNGSRDNHLARRIVPSPTTLPLLLGCQQMHTTVCCVGPTLNLCQ